MEKLDGMVKKVHERFRTPAPMIFGSTEKNIYNSTSECYLCSELFSSEEDISRLEVLLDKAIKSKRGNVVSYIR